MSRPTSRWCGLPGPTGRRADLAALLLAAILPLAGCERERGGPAQGPDAAGPATGQGAAASRSARERALVARVQQHPDDLQAALSLGHLYYDTDRPHRAVPLYRAVLEHHDDPAVRTDLGTCYKRMGLLDKARAEYERVLADHPKHLQATYNLAVVSELAGELPRAADLWERAADLAPPGSAIARAARQHAAAARKALAQTAPGTARAPATKESQP
ncbi:MAG: tetratricopeptide repeat protein [Planctomycetota bacterium]